MKLDVWNYLNPLDEEALKRQYHSGAPTSYFAIDELLQPGFLREAIAAYPEYAKARAQGREFAALNERLKIQVTNPEHFPEPIRILNDILAAEDFLGVMRRVTGIDGLLADERLSGGGMHIMGSGGRLDVHVDFNILKKRDLHRRLNVLVFLNETWQEDWGGHFELWDPSVKNRIFSAMPGPNRCVVFNTTDSSYHGVTPVTSPENTTRNSFAAYYYTPLEGQLEFHDTIFKARPEEWFRRNLGIPAVNSVHWVRDRLRGIKRAVVGQREDSAN